MLGPATAPISNVFTGGDETPADKALDAIVPAEVGEQFGNAVDTAATATGYGDSGDGTENNGSQTVPIPAQPRG